MIFWVQILVGELSSPVCPDWFGCPLSLHPSTRDSFSEGKVAIAVSQSLTSIQPWNKPSKKPKEAGGKLRELTACADFLLVLPLYHEDGSDMFFWNGPSPNCMVLQFRRLYFP
jgi:hypothetical protein